MSTLSQLIFGAFFVGCSLLSPISAKADGDEIAMFDKDGSAVAYIAVSDELTIYLWGGKPVAYLQAQDSDKFTIYGFNGHHLGWFWQGVIWDHEGNGSCAVKERLQYTQFEAFKGSKEFKPFKGFQAYAPLEPSFTSRFGSTPCMLLLASGRN